MRRGAAELLRFGLVSTLGLGVDLLVAYGLAALLEISLPLAALAGFLAGAALNYALHHLWTFRAVPRRR
ncbi:GtrA family protein, partial [Cereibacter changlensis JA139]